MHDTVDEVVSSVEESSETDPDTGVTTEEKKELKDGVTTEDKTVTAPDGSGSIEKTVTEANGDVKGGSVTKAAGGEVSEVTNSSTVNGVTKSEAYAGDANGLTLNKVEGATGAVNVGGSVKGVDGGEYTVKAIGENTFEGNTDITSALISGALELISSGAFKDCSNLEEITFGVTNSPEPTQMIASGKKKAFSITLGKNCLKGTSKKLVIKVPDKKMKKDVKKQLKKAGNKKAKVKVVN